MQWDSIRDSYNNGYTTAVARYGRVYVVASNFTRYHGDSLAADMSGVTDWADGKKPRTQEKVLRQLAASGMAVETRYDASHGRAYDLCAYPRGDEHARRVCLAAQSGMSDTNPEIARPLAWDK